MKKFICAMLSLLLLMPSACIGFSASAEAQADPELRFRSVSGKWETENGRVAGGGDGNVFCVSDTFLEKDQSWCFSAKVRIFSGNAAGLAFGIPKPDNPAARWHCVNFSQSGGYSAMFRETDAKNDYIRSRGLSESEKQAEYLTIRVECDAGKTITGYVNGAVTYTYQTDDYQGGYIAVMCCGAQAEFEEISLKLSQTPCLTSLNASDIEFDVPFNAEETNYWGTVEFDISKTEISAKADGDNTVAINGSAGNTCEVALNVGLNTIPITVTSREGLTRTVKVNIVRRQSPSLLYNERRRMQLHFSPEAFSINDPNGLIYDEYTGLYHLFFQCDYAFRGYQGGGETKSWGHAVSRNLIDWEETALAITPDENGVCWSGSGVIDKNNTSGLFDESVPPESRMVFLYTYYGGKNGLGQCSVGLAWSADHGVSFNKYKEAVIPNTNNMYSAGFRDPKVIWYDDPSMENGGTWVLIGCGDRAMLFTSPDLINWTYNSTIRKDGRPLVTECPDLFPMELDGTRYWVLYAAGAWYMLGDLGKNANGKICFTPASDKITPVDGVKELWPGSAESYGLFCENYASQTFYCTQDGRRIQMSWMRDFGGYQGKTWWNGLSLPTELRLESINGQPRITYHPIRELAQKRSETLLELKDRVVSPAENPLEGITGPLLDIEAEIDMQTASEFGLRLCIGSGKYIELKYDAASGTVCTDKSRMDESCAFVYKTKLQKSSDTVTLRVILDANALDVWYNNEVYHGGMAYNSADGQECALFCDAPVKILTLNAYRLSRMNRDSITENTAMLDELNRDMAAALSAGDKDAAVRLLERYDALSNGERACMPAGSNENAQALRQLAGSTKSMAGVIIGACAGAAVLAGGITAAIIAKKRRKKQPE